MRYLLGLIAVGVILLFGAYYQQYCPNWFGLSDATQVWFGNALLNLGSGILTSVLIIYAYDRILEKNNLNIRKNRQRVALAHMKILLNQHLSFICELYKCSRIKKREDYVSITDCLLDQESINSVEKLDFRKPSPASSMMDIPWYTYCYNHFFRIDKEMTQIMSIYNQDLDVTLSKIIHDFQHSQLLLLSKSLPQVITFLPRLCGMDNYPTNFFNDRNMVHDHVKCFNEIIAFYNKNVDEAVKIQYGASLWHNDFFPDGCGRLDNNIFNPLKLK